MTEKLRRTAEQAVRTAANATRAHLREFESVARRMEKPLSRSTGAGDQLHTDAVARDRLFDEQSEAHRAAHAAVEALRKVDPSGADKIVRLSVMLARETQRDP